MFIGGSTFQKLQLMEQTLSLCAVKYVKLKVSMISMIDNIRAAFSHTVISDDM